MGEKFHFCFPNACKIELHMFKEDGTFISVDSEMWQLLAYFDNPVLLKVTFLSPISVPFPTVYVEC